ncbi:1,4-dihydroxy-2-naphthoate polyprenyltransferase [Gracilimonas mengyeensis]|uniref:1,4-dihydroxy-2-naphthoate octaprenyltransferase n=1 Tax=Gracilimonas mengyeensis TaxID=1302730 RepID=A0A521ADS0_9BACT|nr:1,4-dihydroxy-2-naphthoate polyprenyltransferase [Gracilimonas mengyeensis]SMO32964.1 1,4-dihydroxy-2-naphthoate prenyltransferase [Gracilimonas mengyeensis]
MNTTKTALWIEAARPQTLPAAIVPVLVGASLAFHDSAFNLTNTIVALICAVLIQIGTNFANDYFDFVKGSDTDERIGFRRATAAGLVSPQKMLNATIITMALAFFLGLYLVWAAGWIVLLIGILSLIFGVLYTGGPFPLGYNGLGDLFVFIFFGIVAVMTTYYVNALEWSWASFWASLAIGGLCVNILVVNNLRDVEQDKKSGKKTLGVLFGETALKLEYLLMVVLAFAIPPHFLVQLQYKTWIMLPFLSLPLAAYYVYRIWTETDKTQLNPMLERTAKFMVLFGVLFSAGILLN